jgi:hypothetical protein
MKKPLMYGVGLVVLTACSTHEQAKENMTAPVKQKNSDTTIHHQLPASGTFAFTSLDDSLLITHLFYENIAYIKPVGFVFAKNGGYTYDDDSTVLDIVSRDTVIGQEDTLYFFCVQGPEFYQHGHTLRDQDIAILKKQGKSWIATDTLIGFVFDQEGTADLSPQGPYFVLTDRHNGSYSGGNFEAGEWFSIFYKGKLVNGLGYLYEANNGGSEGCMAKYNQEFTGCNCYAQTGKGGVSVNKKNNVLLIETTETSTYYEGDHCEDSSVVTEKKTMAFYKSYAKTILDMKTEGRKKEITTNVAINAFLQEAKKTLGEK